MPRKSTDGPWCLYSGPVMAFTTGTGRIGTCFTRGGTLALDCARLCERMLPERGEWIGST